MRQVRPGSASQWLYEGGAATSLLQEMQAVPGSVTEGGVREGKRG